MKKHKSLAIEIEELEASFDGAYFESLVEALSRYHSMVESGILIPRGNRLASNPANYSSNYSKRA